jgi:hypothetical protein
MKKELKDHKPEGYFKKAAPEVRPGRPNRAKK